MWIDNFNVSIKTTSIAGGHVKLVLSGRYYIPDINAILKKTVFMKDKNVKNCNKT